MNAPACLWCEDDDRTDPNGRCINCGEIAAATERLCTYCDGLAEPNCEECHGSGVELAPGAYLPAPVSTAAFRETLAAASFWAATKHRRIEP